MKPKTQDHTHATTPGPKEVVDAYLRAIAARDFEGARRWLADGPFVHRSPISSFTNADAYIADISRIGPILEAVERRRTFVDGNEVCVVVNYITRMDRREVTPAVHWLTILGGKIASIETFFDARGYARLFEVD
jgi:hypothetical protein